MLLRCYRDGVDPKLSGSWLSTGDVGELTDDGRLVVHGRRGDLIITGGENVWPEPVERVLAAVAGVADVAVAARDDPEWGQRVVAFVVPRLERAADPRCAPLRGEGSARRPRRAARARARRRSPAHGARQGAARRAPPPL